jgi:hypothetical protein
VLCAYTEIVLLQGDGVLRETTHFGEADALFQWDGVKDTSGVGVPEDLQLRC